MIFFIIGFVCANSGWAPALSIMLPRFGGGEFKQLVRCHSCKRAPAIVAQGD